MAMTRVTACIAAIGLCLALLPLEPTRALPSFARQTGQECAACHNGFPELTPYGRLFKLNGYVFPGSTSDIPSVSAMVVDSFTHTQAPQPGGPAPHYSPNDNPAFELASLFYGGAISTELGIGAFIQTTYDHVAQRYSWDNTDIRWATSGTLLDEELVAGISLNNSPTVTDLWNTTPAWRYPYQSSALAPGPAAATLIEGGLAGTSGGVTAYGFWDRLIYAEVGVYHTLSTRGESMLGVDPTGSSSTDGPALYWRAALEQNWEQHSLEAGTFGLAASIHPGRVADFGSDRITDIGIDSQYQFLGAIHSVSLQTSYIREQTSLDSSLAQGLATNLHDGLSSFHVKTSYSYDQTYAATAGYFRVAGHADAGLYGGVSANSSPNSSGITGELDYTPFNHGGPSFWPWANLRLGLQYTHYLKFDGAADNYDGIGSSAGGSDTLYLFSWFAF